MRKKIGSKVLGSMRKRLAGMKAIEEGLNLGHGISEKVVSEKAAGIQTQVDAYNQSIAEGDAARTELRILEADGRDLNERILAAVMVKYGKDSTEYQKVGGVRKSERKKPGKKKAQVAKRKGRKSRHAPAQVAPEAESAPAVGGAPKNGANGKGADAAHA